MADTRYLKQRRQGWYFIIAVPRDLRRKLSKQKIEISLATRDLSQAQQDRWPKVVEHTEYFERLRNGAPLTPALIDAQALQLYTATLARMEANARRGKRAWAESEAGDDEDPEIRALDMVADELAEAIEEGDCGAVAEEISAVVTRTGVAVQPGSEAHQQLGEALLEAKHAALRGRIAGLRGQPSEPPASFLPGGLAIDLATLQRANTARPRPARRKGGLMFADVAARFIAERQSDASVKLTEQTRGQYEAVFRMFDSWANQPRLDDIDRRKASDFLDGIATLHRHWGRGPGVRALTFAEIVKRHGGRTPGLSNRTINRYAMALSMVWQFAEDRDGYEGKNPWHRQSRKTAGKRGNSEVDKRGFKPSELAKLLSNAPVTAPNIHTPATALPWLTLIGAYSGMRLNEICELEHTDVKQDSRIWIFDLTASKSEAGVRVVPIHSRILAAGFLDYRKRIGAGPLFPGLLPGGPDGKRSWYVSKRFTKVRRGLELIDIDQVTGRDRIDFHSLRRSAITALKHARIPEHEVAEVVGHEHPLVTFGIYPDRQKLGRLQQVIEAISY